VTVESTVIWDVTPGSLLKVSPCFMGTYSFHLQDRKTVVSTRFLAGCLAILFDPDDGGNKFLRNVTELLSSRHHIPEYKALLDHLLQDRE
jgi:hypothetical protein